MSEYVQRLRDLIGSMPDRLTCWFMQDDDELSEALETAVTQAHELRQVKAENTGLKVRNRELEERLLSAHAELYANGLTP